MYESILCKSWEAFAFITSENSLNVHIFSQVPHSQHSYILQSLTTSSHSRIVKTLLFLRLGTTPQPRQCILMHSTE